MANIKNFGLVGVGSEVQFGKGGAKLIQDSGSFAARNAADDAFVTLQVADGSTANDAVNFSQLDDAVSTLQTEIDAIETAVGLDTDGTFIAFSGSNYIDSSTSIVDALSDLDAQIKANADAIASGSTDVTDIQTEIDAIETAVGLDTDGTFLGFTGSNYLDASTSVMNALSLLDTQVDTNASDISTNTGAISDLQTEVDAIETAVGLDTDGTFIAFSGTNYVDAATSVVNAITLLDTQVATNASDISTNTGAISDLQTEVDAIETAVGLNTDGTFASFSGSNYLDSSTSIVDALSTLDTELSDVLDTVVSLGNAFNYVGTVTGGVDAPSAFDLSTLTEKDSGDYYKVTTSGYVKNTSSGPEYYVNVNDGLVKNITADGWDIIDNTNSVVSGTTNLIDVSGSTDTGFVVTISSTFTDRVDTLETEASNMQTAVGLDTDGTFIAFSGSNYIDSSTSIVDALSDLDAQIKANADAIASGSTDVTDIQTEIDAIETAVGLDTDGTFLGFTGSNYLDASTSVMNALSLLDTQVDTNASDISDVQTEVDAIETAVGLDTDGTFIGFSGSNYLDSSTSVVDALSDLDTQVKANADAIDGLDATRIHDTGDTTYVDTDSVANTVVVGANSGVAAYFESTSGNDSYFTFDTATAGEVRVEASGSATDVDIRLVPKGTGHVIIGDTGAGSIQAEDDQDMTLAGGDGVDGGDLILKGGDGSSTDGVVRIQNGAADEELVLDGATVTADGSATDIDLVLAPKGTGDVSVSGAKVVDVATPTDGTDAANKAYVDSAVTAGVTGGVQTRTVAISETTGAVNIGAVVTGTVLRARVVVADAFTTGATITLGTSGDTDLIALAADIDAEEAGIYLIEVAEAVSAAQLVADVTAGSGATGTATVIVEYLSA